MPGPTDLAMTLAALGALLRPAIAAASPRGPLQAKNPDAVHCELATTELDGEVHLDRGCFYTQALKIKRSDTSLDCHGAELRGDAEYLITVAGEIARVVVQNCYVRGGLGIAVRPPARRAGESDAALRARSPREVVLRNLHVSGSQNVGVYLHHHVVGATLRASIVVDNSSAGVYLSPYGQGHQILDNRIAGNGHLKPDGTPRLAWYRREGIAVDASSQHRIEGNDLVDNALGGVLLYKNCWEHAASDPGSTPRTEHAHSSVIRGNRFADMPFGVWVAARQSRDLDLMECGDPTPYANPIWTATVFHPDYSSHASAYTEHYLPWVSVWPDFAENNRIEDNLFEGIARGGVRVEDDGTRVTGNLFIGDFDYVFVGAPFRARLDNHPVLDTAITGNSFFSPGGSSFAARLALIPDEHQGTVLQDNHRACAAPDGSWLRHDALLEQLAAGADAADPCAPRWRRCDDGVLGAPAPDPGCAAVDAGPVVDAGVAADAGAIVDTGMVSDAEVDADAGAIVDTGTVSDVEVDTDAGAIVDTGRAADAGTVSDAEVDADAGTIVDGAAGCDCTSAGFPVAGPGCLVVLFGLRRRRRG